MKLYEWQKSCLENWKKNEYRGIVNVITGAGKTMAALAAMDYLSCLHPDLRIKIVVPTIPLANQWNQALLKHASSIEETPGFFGGGKKDSHDRRIMIYIINSARMSLASHIQREFSLNHPVFLICDECHHYQSKENRKIFDFLSFENSSEPSCFNRSVIHNLYYCMGLSATPFGTRDDRFLTSVLGNEIFSYGFQQASADQIISSFYVCQTSVSFLPDELKKYRRLTEQVRAALNRLLQTYPHLKSLGKEEFMKAVTAISHKADMDPEEPASQFLLMTYQRKNVSVLSRARLLCCVNLIRELPEQSRIILFCEQMEQAEDIYRMIGRLFGPIAGLYHSAINAEARKRIIAQFRDRSIRVLCSCRCLDEGIDVPDADIGIVISSSAVSRQRIQRLGRIIRRAPGKHAACLYYIYVRESTDEIIYLDKLAAESIFNLKYYTSEDSFSNEIYEYAAREVMEQYQNKNSSPEVLAQLRTCLLEGLTRPDYLLPKTVQNALMEAAPTIHQKNYWHTMKLVGSYFHTR